LIAALKDANPGIRYAAAMLLAWTDPPAFSAVPTLIKALKDKINDVRLTVIWALGAIGPQAIAAVPPIEELLNDDDAAIRNMARAAMHRIKSL